MAKIDKKLLYWVKTRVNSAGREVIANSVLISTCLYFVAICSGTKAGVARITGKIRNFYWSGTPHTSRVRVAWQTCCLQRHEGGLNLIDPGAAVVALMSKWILSACEPRASNFKTILRYRLSLFQPHPQDRWAPSLDWFLQPTHKSSVGSKVWLRTTRAWKSLAFELRPTVPASFTEWMSSTFWWAAG
jgi:hypothetical protein